MPKKRLSMRKFKEVLRLKAIGLSNRQIAQSTKVSHSTGSKLTTPSIMVLTSRFSTSENFDPGRIRTILSF